MGLLLYVFLLLWIFVGTSLVYSTSVVEERTVWPYFVCLVLAQQIRKGESRMLLTLGVVCGALLAAMWLAASAYALFVKGDLTQSAVCACACFLVLIVAQLDVVLDLLRALVIRR